MNIAILGTLFDFLDTIDLMWRIYIIATFQVNQTGHLNPSEETGTGCPVISKYGMTHSNKHGGVGRQQQQQLYRSINYYLSPIIIY